MSGNRHICGCFYVLRIHHPQRHYLPQVSLKAHTTILATTSRTVLTQTFVNPSESKGIKELRYIFPLNDGVSVVGFQCRVDDRIIVGEVKEKEKAKAVYKAAVDAGQTAGLFEQLPEAADVFSTTIGNVAPGAKVLVDITYLGELKHDAEVDGLRFNMPTTIAPRYGSYPGEMANSTATEGKSFEVTVDCILGEGSFIRELRSPSHPIAVSVGTTSTSPDADPQTNKASATLSLGTAELDKDFVLQVVTKETGIPKAMLETHPTIAGQRALMATLVPKFALPPERPEIVFVCDRSGSMAGSNIEGLKNALKVFLKSLPVGVKFNICSFGSRYSFLWNQSKAYSQSTLEEAMRHVESFGANFGGTEMLQPIKATLEKRFKDMSLEVFLVTDGEIWDQTSLFTLLNQEILKKKAPIRVFTLGIGSAVSSSLIEGVARAGNGFSQTVGHNEKMDGKVVRMLKAALSPHVTDYSIEIKYGGSKADKEYFELVEKVNDCLKLDLGRDDSSSDGKPTAVSRMLNKMIKNSISLFDTSANPDAEIAKPDHDEDGQAKFSHLPAIDAPRLLQAPHSIPPLFSFSRTSVYLLMSPSAIQRTPKSVVLRGTSKQGPLELEIPVQVLEAPGETIHQLAAKKAVQELEEGRGWLYSAQDQNGKPIEEKYPGRFDEMVEREAIRLGVQFQVGGKFCSFVAVEKREKSKDSEGDEMMTEKEYDFLDDFDPETLSDADENRRRISSITESGERLDALVDKRAALSSQSNMFYTRAKRSGGGFPGSGLFASASSALQVRRSGSAAPPPPPSGGSLFRAPARPMYSAQEMSACYAAPQASYACYSMPGEGQANQSAFGFFGSSAPQYGAADLAPASMAAAPQGPMTRSRMSAAGPAPRKQPASKEVRKSAPSKWQAEIDPEDEKCAEEDAPLPTDPLQALIALQGFMGYWEWNEQLCGVLGIDVATVAMNNRSVDTSVLATALAVRFFEVKLAKEKDIWELLVDKAKSWLEEQGCGEDSDIWEVVKGIIA